MKQIITAKLKLHTDTTQFQTLRVTQLAYRDALNYVSRYSFEHGKMSNQRRLQQACYDDIRLLYHLPAQMACSAPKGSEPPTKHCGQRRSRMLKLKGSAGQKNATGAWTSPQNLSPPRSPITTSATTP